MKRDNTKDATPFAVYCFGHDYGIDEAPNPEGCGLQFLTYEQYSEQLARPNQTWRCPRCWEEAQWDDHCRETDPPPYDPDKPDANCFTLEDGSCVGQNCMHIDPELVGAQCNKL